MSETGRLLAVKKSGDPMPAYIRLKPTHIDGKALVVVGIDDVSELETIEQHKAQAQKLEALGEMVSGIAHYFNNMLAGISGQSYLIQSQNSLDPSIRNRLQSIDTLCEKASGMIHQLMLYARNSDSELRKTNIIPALRQAVDLCRISLPPPNFQLIEQFRVEQVLCEPGQLQQVLINLINNAVQAIDGAAGGRIAVKVMACPSCDCNHAKCPAGLSSGSGPRALLFCIKVRDNGSRIPVATMDRVFDPFFSTKPSGEGTGLGLSTAFGTITQLNSHITARNRNKHGAEIQFYLPVSEAPDGHEQQERIEHTTRVVRPATLLLMEDDEDMLQLLGDIVEGFGYRTIIVCDEGLAAFNDNRIDLVITDVVMPMMDGMTAMRLRNADMPCIYLTGFRDAAPELGARDLVMMKPFDIIRLSRDIDRLLAASAPTQSSSSSSTLAPAD